MRVFRTNRSRKGWKCVMEKHFENPNFTILQLAVSMLSGDDHHEIECSFVDDGDGRGGTFRVYVASKR